MSSANDNAAGADLAEAISLLAEKGFVVISLPELDDLRKRAMSPLTIENVEARVRDLIAEAHADLLPRLIAALEGGSRSPAIERHDDMDLLVAHCGAEVM